jgi:hypothetical protein
MGFKDLFRPKWKHSDWRVRETAVLKLKDQKVLIRVVKNDKDPYVREAAVEKLKDKRVLTWLIRDDKDEDVRKAAERRLEALEKQCEDCRSIKFGSC